MRSPHLQIMLADLGFRAAADAFDAATTREAELAAVRTALANVEGALLILHRYRRGLRDTRAAYERGQLVGLEKHLLARLSDLLVPERAAS